MENTKQWEFVKELRKFGEPELTYLKEVLDKGAMSILKWKTVWWNGLKRPLPNIPERSPQKERQMPCWDWLRPLVSAAQE